MKHLDVGCGLVQSKRANTIYLDIENVLGIDMRGDIISLPFKDSSFDEIYAFHVLEHIPDVKKAITELARVLKSDGILLVRVPHYKSENAFNDLEHMHFFTPHTFDFWTDTEQARRYRHRYSLLFDTVSVRVTRRYPLHWHLENRFPKLRTFLDRLMFFGKPDEIRFTLRRL